MTTLLASEAALYSERNKGLDSKATSSMDLKHPHDGDQWQLVDLAITTETPTAINAPKHKENAEDPPKQETKDGLKLRVKDFVSLEEQKPLEETPTTINAPKHKENAEDPKQETKDDLKLRVKDFVSLEEQKPLDLATARFGSGFYFGGVALNNCERGLLWVDERDTQRKKSLSLTPWKEYHQQRLKKERRERPPSPFSYTCILFILSFWFVRLGRHDDPSLTWILWTYLIPSAIMYACLQPFENRHGGKKAALLTLGALGAAAILSLSYNPHQSVLDPTSLAFASLGLAHADLCVNWDLLMLGQTRSDSMSTFLLMVSIDLILLPYLLAYEETESGKEIRLACVVAHLCGFCLTLPFARRLWSSAILGPPPALHGQMLSLMKVACPPIVLASIVAALGNGYGK